MSLTAERDKRVAWIRRMQEAGQSPSVDLYSCDCGRWTIAVQGTPDIRCECGKAPRYEVTVQAAVEPSSGRGVMPAALEGGSASVSRQIPRGAPTEDDEGRAATRGAA